MNFNLKKHSFFLFGAGENCKMLLFLIHKCKLELEIKYIVDNDAQHKTTNFEGYLVKNPNMLINEINPFIIITSDYFYNDIKKQLQKMGYKENLNFINAKDILPVLLWEQTGKVAMMDTAFHITTRCTLKCRNCLQRNPYLKNKTDRDLKIIQSEIINYFNIVDFVYQLTLVGGEPMLYKQLDDLILWIFDHFTDKIQIVNIITNGTVLPSNEFLKKCEKKSIRFDISDYKPNINSDSAKKLMDILKNNNIKFKHIKHEYWTQMWRNEGLEKNEIVNWEKFKSCNNKCRTVYNNKFSYCAQLAAEMFMNDNLKILPQDYFDLSNFFDLAISKECFVKFNAFFEKKHCFSVCKKCNGSNNISFLIPPGEQISE